MALVQIPAPPTGGIWTQLATGTLTGTSVVVSGLTQSENLLILASGWSHNSTNQQIRLRINGDSGTNYYEPGTPGNTSSGLQFSNTMDGTLVGYSGCLIVGAKTQTPKLVLAISGNSVGGTYNSATAITSITFLTTGGSFDAGTYFIWGN